MRPVVFLALLVLAGPATAAVLFQENFERGANPFGFDGYIAGEAGAGEQAIAAGRGGVWMTLFRRGSPGGRFGHRLAWRPAWGASHRLYWAAYVRFGFRSGSPEWATLGAAPYELRLPQFGGEGEPQVYGRFTRLDDVGNQGTFALLTADGQVHSDAAEQPLVSGRWYLVQIALEDRGGSDRVRIWIDNTEESSPDYDYIGGDMLSFAAWTDSTPIQHGSRLHVPAADARLYYDSITLASDFIRLPLPLPLPGAVPAAPANLRVE